MNKNYEVTWCVLKKEGEKNGKAWKIMTMNLKDLSDGTEIEGVDTFDEVAPGHKIEGEITSGQYGMNFKKSPTAKAVAGASFKAKQIDETMARKETSIRGFQDNKEFSIMVASSMSQAVNLAIAEFQYHNRPVNNEDMQKIVLQWRNWIISNWNVDKTDTPAF